MQTSEVLYTAADLIEKRGWWSPRQASPCSNLCAGNALSNAAGGGVAHLTAYHALAVYLSGHRGLSVVWAWNDAPGRTATEVIEVLRATAVIEAAKEQAASDLADALDVAPVGVRS